MAAGGALGGVEGLGFISLTHTRFIPLPLDYPRDWFPCFEACCRSVIKLGGQTAVFHRGDGDDVPE